MKSAPDPVAVRDKMLAHRRLFSLTQRALAEKLKCSPGLIGEMERGVIRSRRVAWLVLELEAQEI